MYVVGPPNRLSSSDLVKSWRGSVAVEVLGVSTRVGHRRCAHAFLHVGTHKVIAWALCSYIRSDCGNFVLSV